MSLKTKLFASVAGPVMVLPLLIQPVHAVPRGLDISSPEAQSHVLRVQQEVVPEEEGQERPRRRAQEGGGEEGGGAERPRRQRDAEQSQEGERPRRQQRESEQTGESERPRRQQQSEQAPEGERPRRQQQSEQAPEGERPRRQQGETQSGETERPRRQQQQETQQSEENQRPQRRQQQTEQAPEGEGQPRRQQQQSEQAPDGDSQQRRQQRDTQQSQENERPRRQQQEQNTTTRTEGGSGERNQARPSRAQPDQDKAASPATREQRAREGQATEQSPTREQEAPAARAAGGERRQAPAAQGEQPTLPVENGAAVLDSAKEQRPERQRREGDRPRRDREQQADQQRAAPRSDAEAQAGREITDEQREQWRSQRRELTEERGERLDRRPDFERPRGWDVRGPARGGDRNRERDRDDSRVIISIDNQEFVRHNDSRRFYRDGREPEYERLGDGRVREIVEREDGTRVITVRNRYGEVVQRSRVARGGDEYVLYYAPELLEDDRDRTWRDPGEDLPPMRLTVPVEDYIIDTSSEPDRDYYEFLEQPPVEQVERVYSLDEVRYSARIRDKVPRIDLDTITFATGSAEVPSDQASSLRKVADAIKKVLDQDPSETFLIEGHTDAVGSDQDNLVLSDERAESVAVVLSDEFGIPPENLTTQGYGEQYLKVKTDAANQENRRVTIRRITPLVKPVASAQ